MLFSESSTQTTQIHPGMQLEDRIYVAGHRGLVGSAMHRGLLHAGYKNIITRTSSELDLRDSAATDDFLYSGTAGVRLLGRR